jgi:hypothetical protein
MRVYDTPGLDLYGWVGLLGVWGVDKIGLYICKMMGNGLSHHMINYGLVRAFANFSSLQLLFSSGPTKTRLLPLVTMRSCNSMDALCSVALHLCACRHVHSCSMTLPCYCFFDTMVVICIEPERKIIGNFRWGWQYVHLEEIRFGRFGSRELCRFADCVVCSPG